MQHPWVRVNRLSIVVMRQLSESDPEVPTAVVEVPATLVTGQLDYPYQVVAAVKEKFCEKFVEFRSAKWWFVTAPVLSMEYNGPLIDV